MGNNRSYTHVIWDFNGTLLNDSGIAIGINQEMNRKRGKMELTPEFYLDHFTHPPEEFYRVMGYTFDKEPYHTVSEEFITEYARRQWEAGLSEGVPRALEAFQKAGLEQLVISAHQEGLLREHIKTLGIQDYFSHIIGVTDQVITGKVERALRFAEETGFDLSEAVFLGDTDHDLETARALGCDCVLYAGGHQSRGRLERLGTPVFGSIGEIADWVLNGLGNKKIQ